MNPRFLVSHGLGLGIMLGLGVMPVSVALAQSDPAGFAQVIDVDAGPLDPRLWDLSSAIVVPGDTQLNVLTGGELNKPLFWLGGQGELNVLGGSVLDVSDVDDIDINLVAGFLGNVPSLASSDGRVTLSGGRIGRGIQPDLTFYVPGPGEGLAIEGGQFRIDGRPAYVPDPDIGIFGFDLFTGVFADGTPFVFAVDDRRSPTGYPYDTGMRFTELTEVDLPALVPVVDFDGTGVVPNGVRPGQTLNVSGGDLGRAMAVVDGTLNLSGGRIGEGLEIAQSEVSVTGGQIGPDASLFGGRLKLSGGTVGSGLNVFSGQLVLEGGTVGSGLRVSGGELVLAGGELTDAALDLGPGAKLTVQAGADHPDQRFQVVSGDAKVQGGRVGELEVARGQVNVTGGMIDELLAVRQDHPPLGAGERVQVNLEGGTIGSLQDGGVEMRATITGGTMGASESGLPSIALTDAASVVRMSGGIVTDEASLRLEDGLLALIVLEYAIDGAAPEEPLDFAESRTIDERGVTLSGLLASGEAFSFDLVDSATLAGDFVGPDAQLRVTRAARPVDAPTPGDFNADGRVAQADLDLVMNNWGQAIDPDDPEWVFDRPPVGDIVRQFHLDRVLGFWGDTVELDASPTSIPEPSGVGIVVGLAGLGLRRRLRR